MHGLEKMKSEGMVGMNGDVYYSVFDATEAKPANECEKKTWAKDSNELYSDYV